MRASLKALTVAVTTILATIPPLAVMAADAPATPAIAGLQVLGIPLASATRDQVRASLRQQSVTATREDDRYWVDLYDAHSVLDGASVLQIGYVLKTGRLAYLQYNFPAFMDSGKVKLVAEMVTQKYGKPISARGRVDLGEVEYVWTLNGGIKLTVSRGWPDTSVSMTYRVAEPYRQMQAELDDNERAQRESNAKAQSHAF